LQQEVTTADKTSKAELTNIKRVERQDAKEEEKRKEETQRKSAEEFSRLRKCRVDGCNYVCISQHKLDLHQAEEDPSKHNATTRYHSHHVPGTIIKKSTDIDLIHVSCSQAVTGFRSIASLSTISATDRVDTSVPVAILRQQMQPGQLAEFDLYVNTPARLRTFWRPGFGHKSRGLAVETTSAGYAFIKFMFERGLGSDGNKTLPAEVRIHILELLTTLGRTESDTAIFH
jgi:hypothetical protein